MNAQEAQMTVSEPALDYAAATARVRWRRNRQPDRFSTRVTVKDGYHTRVVKVSIAHKETFPLGGRAYSLSITDPEKAPVSTSETPQEPLRRETLHLAADEILA